MHCHIAGEFGRNAGNVDPEDVARSVCAILARHLSSGTVEHVAATLPREIRYLLMQ